MKTALHTNETIRLPRTTADILRRRIMHRVYAIWFAKKVLSPWAVKSYLLAGLLAQAIASVSLQDIAANSPSIFDIPRASRFFGSAFINTETMLQISTVAMALLAAWICSDFFRRQKEEW